MLSFSQIVPSSPPPKSPFPLSVYLLLQAAYLERLDEKIYVYKGLNIVGREQCSHVQIPHEALSSKHALIFVEDEDHHFVSDLKSSNGTKVNEVLIADDSFTTLNDGDKLAFGDYEFLYFKVPSDVDLDENLSGIFEKSENDFLVPGTPPKRSIVIEESFESQGSICQEDVDDTQLLDETHIDNGRDVSISELKEVGEEQNSDASFKLILEDTYNSEVFNTETNTSNNKSTRKSVENNVSLSESEPLLVSNENKASELEESEATNLIARKLNGGAQTLSEKCEIVNFQNGDLEDDLLSAESKKIEECYLNVGAYKSSEVDHDAVEIDDVHIQSSEEDRLLESKTETTNLLINKEGNIKSSSQNRETLVSQNENFEEDLSNAETQIYEDPKVCFMASKNSEALGSGVLISSSEKDRLLESKTETTNLMTNKDGNTQSSSQNCETLVSQNKDLEEDLSNAETQIYGDPKVCSIVSKNSEALDSGDFQIPSSEKDQLLESKTETTNLLINKEGNIQSSSQNCETLLSQNEDFEEDMSNAETQIYEDPKVCSMASKNSESLDNGVQIPSSEKDRLLESKTETTNLLNNKEGNIQSSSQNRETLVSQNGDFEEDLSNAETQIHEDPKVCALASKNSEALDNGVQIPSSEKDRLLESKTGTTNLMSNKDGNNQSSSQNCETLVSQNGDLEEDLSNAETQIYGDPKVYVMTSKSSNVDHIVLEGDAVQTPSSEKDQLLESKTETTNLMTNKEGNIQSSSENRQTLCIQTGGFEEDMSNAETQIYEDPKVCAMLSKNSEADHIALDGDDVQNPISEKDRLLESKTETTNLMTNKEGNIQSSSQNCETLVSQNGGFEEDISNAETQISGDPKLYAMTAKSAEVDDVELEDDTFLIPNKNVSPEEGKKHSSVELKVHDSLNQESDDSFSCVQTQNIDISLSTVYIGQPQKSAVERADEDADTLLISDENCIYGLQSNNLVTSEERCSLETPSKSNEDVENLETTSRTNLICPSFSKNTLTDKIVSENDVSAVADEISQPATQILITKKPPILCSRIPIDEKVVSAFKNEIKNKNIHKTKKPVDNYVDTEADTLLVAENVCNSQINNSYAEEDPLPLATITNPFKKREIVEATQNTITSKSTLTNEVIPKNDDSAIDEDFSQLATQIHISKIPPKLCSRKIIDENIISEFKNEMKNKNIPETKKPVDNYVDSEADTLLVAENVCNSQINNSNAGEELLPLATIANSIEKCEIVEATETTCTPRIPLSNEQVPKNDVTAVDEEFSLPATQLHVTKKPPKLCSRIPIDEKVVNAFKNEMKNQNNQKTKKPDDIDTEADTLLVAEYFYNSQMNNSYAEEDLLPLATIAKSVKNCEIAEETEAINTSRIPLQDKGVPKNDYFSVHEEISQPATQIHIRKEPLKLCSREVIDETIINAFKTEMKNQNVHKKLSLKKQLMKKTVSVIDCSDSDEEPPSTRVLAKSYSRKHIKSAKKEVDDDSTTDEDLFPLASKDETLERNVGERFRDSNPKTQIEDHEKFSSFESASSKRRLDKNNGDGSSTDDDIVPVEKKICMVNIANERFTAKSISASYANSSSKPTSIVEDAYDSDDDMSLLPSQEILSEGNTKILNDDIILDTSLLSNDLNKSEDNRLKSPESNSETLSQIQGLLEKSSHEDDVEDLKNELMTQKPSNCESTSHFAMPKSLRRNLKPCSDKSPQTLDSNYETLSQIQGFVEKNENPPESSYEDDLKDLRNQLLTQPPCNSESSSDFAMPKSRRRNLKPRSDKQSKIFKSWENNSNVERQENPPKSSCEDDLDELQDQLLTQTSSTSESSSDFAMPKSRRRNLKPRSEDKHSKSPQSLDSNSETLSQIQGFVEKKQNPPKSSCENDLDDLRNELLTQPPSISESSSDFAMSKSRRRNLKLRSENKHSKSPQSMDTNSETLSQIQGFVEKKQNPPKSSCENDLDDLQDQLLTQTSSTSESSSDFAMPKSRRRNLKPRSEDKHSKSPQSLDSNSETLSQIQGFVEKKHNPPKSSCEDDLDDLRKQLMTQPLSNCGSSSDFAMPKSRRRNLKSQSDKRLKSLQSLESNIETMSQIQNFLSEDDNHTKSTSSSVSTKCDLYELRNELMTQATGTCENNSSSNYSVRNRPRMGSSSNTDHDKIVLNVDRRIETIEDIKGLDRTSRKSADPNQSSENVPLVLERKRRCLPSWKVKENLDNSSTKRSSRKRKNATSSPPLSLSLPPSVSTRKESKYPKLEVEHQTMKPSNVDSMDLDIADMIKMRKRSASIRTSSISPADPQLKNQKVIFTSLKNKELKIKVEKLGGTVVNSPSDCTVLVAEEVKRSVKFLCALGSGKPIVSPKWIQESSKAHAFLDPWKYLLLDGKKEKALSFSLKESLLKARGSPLLKGYSIFVTPSVKPPPVEMKDIIQSCGGSFLQKSPVKWPSRSVVISCTEDEVIFEKIKSRVNPIPIVKAEALISGILRQSLNFEAHLL